MNLESLNEVKNEINEIKISTKKDMEYLRCEVTEIKDDVKAVRTQLDSIRQTLILREGNISAFKILIPYALTVLGIFLTLVVYVGFDQRLQQERELKESIGENSKKIENVYKILGQNRE